MVSQSLPRLLCSNPSDQHRAGDEPAKKYKGIIEGINAPDQVSEAQRLSSELWEKYIVPNKKKATMRTLLVATLITIAFFFLRL